MHHQYNPSSPKPPPQPSPEKPSTEREEEEDADGQEDDFYGRTREIITFAEQGTYEDK